MRTIIKKAQIGKYLDTADEYIEFSSGHITIIDNNITIETDIDTDGDDFDFVVNASIMKKACQYSPDVIVIEDDENHIVINDSYRINKIIQLDAIDDIEFENDISVKNISTMIRKTTPIIEDGTQPEYIGTKIEAYEGHFAMYAGGHGYSIRSTTPCENDFPGALVLRKDLKKIAFVNDADISRSSNFVSVKSGKDAIRLKRLNGDFPDFNKLLSLPVNFSININRVELLQSIKESILFYDKQSFQSEFTLSKNQIEINTNNPNMGSISKKIEIDFDGDEIIHFNARRIFFFLDIIENEMVELFFIGKPNALKIVDVCEDIETVFILAPLKG